MGINNDTKLIFGTVLDRDTVDKLIVKYGEEIIHGNGTYEGCLFIGYVSDYYDADEEGISYFVSITDPDTTEYDINNLRELLNDNDSFDEYRLFLENVGIYNEPKLISLVHIW